MRNAENDALALFLQTYRPFLNRFGQNIARTSTVFGVDDVVQELTIAAMKAMRSPGYQDADEPLRYMVAAARNHGLNMLRDEGKQPETISQQNFTADTLGMLDNLMPTADPDAQIEARDLLVRVKQIAADFPDTEKGRVWQWVINALTDPTEALIDFAQEREYRQEVEQRNTGKRTYRGATGFEVCSKEDLQEFVGCGWRSIQRAIAEVRKALDKEDAS